MMELKLKDIRENLELTQRKMANKLGISKSYYNAFETLERIIPVKRLNDYSNLFHISFDYVFELTKHNNVTKEIKEIDRKLVGIRLKEIRKMKKLTQKQLADILNTSQSTISSYEKGNSLILTAFLYQICHDFNVSADYIVGKTNTMKIIN